MRKFITMIAVLLASTIYAQKEAFRFNLVKGETYDHYTKTSSTIKQEIAGQKMEIALTVSGWMQFKVIDKIDNVYQMNVVYKKLAMKMSMAEGMGISFDSENRKPEDVMSQLLGKMVNMDFAVKMTDAGVINEVKNIDVVVEKMLSDMAVPEEQKAQLKQQFLQTFGEKSFKGNIEMATNIFTDHAVGKGDKWTIATTLAGTMPAKLVTEYEYQGNDKGTKIITGNGKITSMEGSSSPISGMETHYNIAGNLTTTIKLDPKTSWIESAVIKQQIKGELELKQEGAVVSKIPVAVQSEINYGTKPK